MWLGERETKCSKIKWNKMREQQNKQLNTTTPGAELNLIFQIQAHVYIFSSGQTS